MTTVLVVDDEPMVRDVVTRYLERDGHRVLTAEDGDGARRIIEREAPGLVLLDVMLPGTSDGLELCRWIRASSELPVILLTARVEEADRIVGLELGADNYMTKPFSPRELATRVKTVLRAPVRAGRPRARLDRDAGDGRRQARGEARRRASHPHRQGVRPALVPRLEREPCLLARPADAPRLGDSAALDTGTVTVHVRRLREKLEDDPSNPRLLETVWGVGYRLRA